MCRPILTAMALVAVASLAAVVPADAIQVQDMKEFKSIQGRYGPKGDCSKYPQVVIDERGFVLDHGKDKLERVTTLDYSASFWGAFAKPDAHAFYPYGTLGGSMPLLALVNADHPGSLRVEGNDFGWEGGPPVPAQYKPWIAGSPYARCATG